MSSIGATIDAVSEASFPMAHPAEQSNDAGAGARVGAYAARLFDTVESPDFLTTLLDGLQTFVAFDNLIVFAYRHGYAADLVFSSLDLEYLRAQMLPYTNGLYLLDPFYIADTGRHESGLLRLSAVAPEAFTETEFYLTFYEAVGVLDELHFVIPLQEGRSVHVFVEREHRKALFSPDDMTCLQNLEPLVSSAVRRHWSWRDRSLVAAQASPIHSAGGIEGVIRNMRRGQLTPREVEVIGLLLRGHSSKLIAHRLGISEGTVTNHKRNVYEKLAIHSQTQLFSMFLRTLSGESTRDD